MRLISYFIYFILTVIIIVTGGYFYMLNNGQKSLIFLSGAGMRAPVTEIAENFARETGINVRTYFEGSSILRDYIINYRNGDIFLPGDKENLEILQEKGLVQDRFFLAWHVVAILIAPDMVGRINGLDDLAEEGLRLAISNPRQASLGRIVMERIIARHPKGREILKNVIVYGSSSQDVLKIYRQGGIDAIIEWNVMASTPEGKGLVVIPLAGHYQVKDELCVGLLRTARDSIAARRFFDYLHTKGREIFRQYGYDVDEDKARQQDPVEVR